PDLLPGEADAAQLGVGTPGDVLGPRVFAAHEGAEPPVDGGRGRPRELLVHDGLREGGKRASPAVDAVSARTHGLDEAGQDGVGRTQVAHGAAQLVGAHRPPAGLMGIWYPAVPPWLMLRRRPPPPPRSSRPGSARSPRSSCTSTWTARSPRR